MRRYRRYFLGEKPFILPYHCAARLCVSVCAWVFAGQQNYKQLTRCHPQLPRYSRCCAAQAILYLCGEVRVACDLWSWERTYVPTYFFFGFHLLSFSFLLFPNDHKEPGIHPQLTPAAAVLLVPPAPRTSWSRSIREYLLWTSSKIYLYPKN